MQWLLKILAGTAGPYLAGGVAALLFAATGGAWLQTARLDHAKDDLVVARAALKNPATGKTWRAEAERDAAALSGCSGKLTAQTASLQQLKTDSDARRDAAARALAANQAEIERYRRGLPAIRAYVPAGATSGERLVDVDRMILEDLRR